MITSRCTLCLGRVISLNKYRNFQTAQVALVRARPLQRVPRIIKRRTERDDDDDDIVVEGEPRTDFLEEAYEHHVRNLNEKKQLLQKILAKKNYGEKRSPDPNMLSWNERQQMIFLHESNPREWTPEYLSESFPALPSTIRKILKRKWAPASINAIRQKDASVLRNWEIYMDGKLKASPELLEHLKKFTDRRDNLRAQLMNEKFYCLPESEKEMDKLRSGKLERLIKMYQENEKRWQSQSKPFLLTSGKGGVPTCDNSSWTVKLEEDESIELASPGSFLPEKDGTSCWTIEDEIREEVESYDLENVDSLLLGQSKAKLGETEMTLDELKKNVLGKSEKGTDSLTIYEKAILKKVVGPTTQDEPKMHNNEGKGGQNVKLLSGTDAAHVEPEGRRTGRRGRRVLEKETVKEEEEVCEIEDEVYTKYPTGNTRLVTSEGLSSLLHAKAPVEVNPEPPEKVKSVDKKKKTPVKYYGTEKDAMVFKEQEEYLAQTCFWETGRSWKMSDEFGALTELHGPHVSGTIKTYDACDYPEKIQIPKDEWQKGMTYRVKDCYYDDDGTFLYRVPGLSKS